MLALVCSSREPNAKLNRAAPVIASKFVDKHPVGFGDE
jgi:hypothetical protein